MGLPGRVLEKVVALGLGSQIGSLLGLSVFVLSSIQ